MKSHTTRGEEGIGFVFAATIDEYASLGEVIDILEMANDYWTIEYELSVEAIKSVAASTEWNIVP